MSTHFLEKLNMEKEIPFDCLVIKQGTIKHLSWADPKYIHNIMEMNDLFKIVKTTADTFNEVMAVNMEVNRYNIQNMTIKADIIGEEAGYLYELFYIDLEKNPEYHTESNLNEIASLVNINGDIIYSNAIIFRNHIPSLTDMMNLCDMSKGDLERILYDRVHTMVVTWDDDWKEQRVVGDLNIFANKFFENSKIEKVELPFLMHNINIWYCEGYEENICGKLLKKPIEKCILFSMKSDEFRCNLTLDEVKKIIKLSTVLQNNYTTPIELSTERIDHMGRKIVYNKYKVLDHMYATL